MGWLDIVLQFDQALVVSYIMAFTVLMPKIIQVKKKIHASEYAWQGQNLPLNVLCKSAILTWLRYLFG